MILPATFYPLPANRHPLPATRHPLPVTRYPLPVTRHPPPATRHPWKSAAGLQLVRSVARSDAKIFPEYVLTSLWWLTQNQEDIVSIAYAENIASLAETALKFLEMA